MGSREGSTMWTHIRDTLRVIWRFTFKPIVPVIGYNLCSASLLASVSPCAVFEPLNEAECNGCICNDLNKEKGVSNTSITVSNQIVNGKNGSHWLMNLIGRGIGFKMSVGSSVVSNTHIFDDNIHQKQPLPVSVISIDTTGTTLQLEHDSCTSAGFTLRKKLQGLIQCCHSWPILPSSLTLAKTLLCPDWPAHSCVFTHTHLSSSLSNVLLYCGVQCNPSAMDKYQDLFHQSQNSWGVCMNNNNNSVTDTPGSGGEVSIDGARKMSHTSENHIPVMLDCKHDSHGIQGSELLNSGPCKCDMNNATSQFVKHNCHLLPHSCAPVTLASSQQNKLIDANFSALTKLCSSCKVTDSQLITCQNSADAPGVVQHQFQSSEENKGKKNKKTRPSAKKRRRLKQKRKSDSHASSDISRTLTTEKQGCENTHRENMDVTMTLGQCVECNMEDEFVVISDISLNKFVMSPDMSSDSDSDDTDGGFVDMDAAAALWDSFTIGNPYDPLSFQFTCTISTNTTTLFSDVEIGTSSRIHDANRKWNESYQEVDFDINNVVDIQDRKVRVEQYN